MERQLRDAGYDAYWESVQTRAGDVIRVRVSVDPTAQDLAAAMTTLRKLGFDPVPVSP